MMRIVTLQHSGATPPGTVVEWAKRKGHELDIRQIFAGAPLPSLSEFDWLIALGGPMNVDEHDRYPWLPREKALLKQAVAAERTCLGLCLGGQLLAHTLGARVGPHLHWEVGWHPVELENGERLQIFQWHQDTFDIPPNARRFATNTITPNQGFAFGDHVVGMQFHPEASEEWVLKCADETPYPTGPHVQTPAQLREGLVHLPRLTAWFFALMDRLEARTTAAVRNTR